MDTIVRIDRHQGKAGLYYATSPNLPGLLVAEATPEDRERALLRAIKNLLAARGINVVVSKLPDSDDMLATVEP